MKRIFALGDFKSNNGPGIANSRLLSMLNKMDVEIFHSQKEGKIFRIYECIKQIVKCDILFICSKSNLNYLAILMSTLLNKKIIYIMHGISSLEYQVNNNYKSKKTLNKIKSYEDFIMKRSSVVVSVSEFEMRYLQSKFPQYVKKLNYIYNSIDLGEIILEAKKSKIVARSGILSAGGDLKLKNNILIADAIRQSDIDIVYRIIGQCGTHLEEDRIKWLGYVSHRETLSLMRKSELYIQNSIFETFGMAVVEALYSGCSILVSENVGCISLFENIEQGDIIYNSDGIDEIKSKINYILSNPNNARLIRGFNSTLISEQWQIEKLKNIIGV